MSNTFKYLRIHLPTKETWECQYPPTYMPEETAKQFYAYTKTEFLDHLVRWNKMNPNRWLYAPIEA